MVISSDLPDIPLPDENIWNCLYPSFKKYEKLTAFINGNTGESLTFGKLMEQSLRWAKELKKYFVGSKAPTVVIILPNCIEFLPLATGSFAVGAVVCPILSSATTDFIGSVLTQVNPDILVIDATLKDKVEVLLSTLQIHPKVYTRGSSKDVEGEIAQILQFGSVLNEEEAGQYDTSSISVIHFSSGTSGNPKAIVFSSKNYLNGSKISSQYSDLCINYSTSESDQQIMAGGFPMAHLFGFYHSIIVNVMFGTKLIIFAHKDSEDLCNFINKYQPHMLFLKPHTIEILSKLDDVSRINNVKCIIAAGSHTDEKATKILQDKVGKDLIIQDCYGLTETFVIGFSPVGYNKFKKGIKVVPNQRIKFIDVNSGEEITKPNELGEILVSGDGIMNYYLHDFKTTKKALDSEYWHHTGDIGSFDEENYIRVVDRVGDFICVGSTKFSSVVLENLIKQQHLVKEVAVIAAPGSGAQDAPKVWAFVVLKNLECLQPEQEIIKFVELEAPKEEMRLTGGVKIMSELPRNAFGKLSKRPLKEFTRYNQWSSWEG